MMKKHITSAIATTVACAALLVGCSSTPDGGTAKTSEPTASETAAPNETVYDECTDGTATILASNPEKGATFELGDCGTVSIVGQATEGSSIHLGTVDVLVIEGDDTDVEVDAAKKIVLAGSDNHVVHGGTPEVVDEGTGNKATAR